MMSREIPVKFSRVITLLGIVSATIIAFAIVVVAFLASLPTIRVLTWHLHHGNNVTFEGHTFHIPLMWASSYDPYRKTLYIEEKHGLGSIELVSTGQVLDATAARQWQAKSIAASEKYDKVQLTPRSSRVINGHGLEFVCLSTDFNSPFAADDLDCRISNTDIRALIFDTVDYRNAVESIITTSK